MTLNPMGAVQSLLFAAGLTLVLVLFLYWASKHTKK